MSVTIAAATLVVTLAAFAWLGVTAGGADRERYLVARSSQTTGRVAFSMFASGMGVWILFAPPQVGAQVGILGAIGYALAAAAPLVVFAWMGPWVRRRLPDGVTLLDWVARRFGRGFQRYVAVVSVGYMLLFITAELTSIGGAFGVLAGVGKLWPVILVAAATAGYTAWGGLPASLRTDRLQAWLILVLAAIAVAAIAITLPAPGPALTAGGLTAFTAAGWQTIVVLVIAVTAANLFHQGYWQRMWAAVDQRAAARGSLLGAALTVPVVFALGLVGMVAAGTGELEVPALAVFELLPSGPTVLLVAVAVLALSLVASSIDTLQNGVVALVSSEVGGRALSLIAAKFITVALTVPAVLVALATNDVLRIFLIADLVAAATVPPVVLGLWSRVDGRGAIAGAVAGLLAVVVVGWVTRGTLLDGFVLLTLPGGVLDFGAFVWAPVASTVVSLAASQRRTSVRSPS